jgi:hypothetical protein
MFENFSHFSQDYKSKQNIATQAAKIQVEQEQVI